MNKTKELSIYEEYCEMTQENELAEDNIDLKTIRESWLHLEYEYPEGERKHIFWIGYSKNGDLHIGISRTSGARKDTRKFVDYFAFVKAFRSLSSEIKVLGKTEASKYRARSYDPDAEAWDSIVDACGPGGYLGDGIYLSGPNKNYP